MSDMAKRHIFSGRVQGVGFRVKVASLAVSHQVKGFVRNMSDGRVELHLEATVAEAEQFVNTIKTCFHGSIHSVAVEEVTSKNCQDFEILS